MAHKDSSIPNTATPVALALLLAGASAVAHGHAHEHKGGIQSKPAKAVVSAFDIVHTRIGTEGNVATFHVAALRVNASVHSPLLCVAKVFKVGSGDLSLPGKVNQ